jgi:hypothetical protein
MITGTWGTDADRSDTVYQSGTSSLQLKNTAVATQLVGPWIPINYYPSHDIYYNMEATVRSDSGANTVTVKFVVYQSDQTTVVTTVNLMNGTVTAANTWQTATANQGFGSSGYWGRYEISKTAAAYNVYIDSVKVKKADPAFYFWNATLSSTGIAQSIAASTWTTVKIENGNYNGVDRQGVSTDTLTLYDAGKWQLNGTVCLQSISSGTTLKIRFVDGSGNMIAPGEIRTAGAAGTQCISHATTTQQLPLGGVFVISDGMQVKMQVWHNDAAGARNVVGVIDPSAATEAITTFSGNFVN